MFLTLTFSFFSLWNCNYIPDNLSLSKWPMCSFCASFPPFINLATVPVLLSILINLFFCHLLSAVIPSSQYVCECPQSPYKDAESSEARVTVSSELFDMSAGYQTQILWKSNKCSHAAPWAISPGWNDFSHQYSQPLGNLEYIIKYIHFLKVNTEFSVLLHIHR